MGQDQGHALITDPGRGRQARADPARRCCSASAVVFAPALLRIGITLVAIAVSIAFLPGIAKALRTPWPSYRGQFILGIVLSWFGVAGSVGWVGADLGVRWSA